MADRPVALRPSRIRSSILAAVCAVGFIALYATAMLTPAGQALDAASLGTFPAFRGEGWLAVYGARDLLLLALLCAAAVAGVECIIRRRWVAAIAGCALIGATAVAGLLLKSGLPRPDLGDQAYLYQTFPSGHAAVSLAAVVATIWFGPRWLRPIVVLVMGSVAVFIAMASLLSFAHRASDIVGGALMVGAFAGATSAMLGSPRIRFPSARAVFCLLGSGSVVVGAALYALALAVLAAGLAGTIPILDVIASSVTLTVGGVMAVVLADQYPIRTAAAS